MEHLPRSTPTDPSTGESAPDPHGVEHRQIVYRVPFDRPATARRRAAAVGACQFVWNEMLDQQAQLYDMARLCSTTPPTPTCFTLGKAFPQLRRVTPWLQAMPFRRSQTERSRRREILHRDFSAALAGLPEIPGHLHPEPGLWRGAESFR